jgi:hypothetical protein
MSNPTHVTVRRTVPRNKSVAEGLAILDSTCGAGAQCAEVQASPVGTQTLAALKSAVATSKKSLASKLDLATALMAAIKAMYGDYALVLVAARTYESAVAGIAQGDATVINKAGCVARVVAPPQTALGKVSVVHGKPWKHSSEGLLTWPRGPGATGYAIQVNFTPQNPAGPWDNLISGTGRRRIVKAPTPGAQFLARVASLGSDGTQSEWSDPVLVTTAF